MIINEEFLKLPRRLQILIHFADVSLKHSKWGPFGFTTDAEISFYNELIEALSYYGFADWHGRLDNTETSPVDIKNFDPYLGINEEGNEESHNQI